MLFGHREEPRRSPPGMLGERVKTNRKGAQKLLLGRGRRDGSRRGRRRQQGREWMRIAGGGKSHESG